MTELKGDKDERVEFEDYHVIEEELRHAGGK